MTFDWRSAGADVLSRYDREIVGWGAWMMLLERLTRVRDGSAADNPLSDWPLSDWLDEFIDGARADQVRRLRQLTSKIPPPCIFVSHRRPKPDVEYAERIAYDACQAGFDYWLDVHDPALTWGGAAIPDSDPIYPILIAAIIEIGLVNATHLLAVQTPKVHGSKWVPYEFGRAKDRSVLSTRVASWAHPQYVLAQGGEYLRLGVIAANEAQIEGWMRAELSALPGPAGGGVWPKTGWPAGAIVPDKLDDIFARNP